MHQWWICACRCLTGSSFGPPRPAIKLHTLLDLDGYIPAFVQVTEAKTADLTVAKLLQLPSGSILAMDSVYIDFAWPHQINENKTSFVTRMKKNIKYQVVQRHQAGAGSRQIYT